MRGDRLEGSEILEDVGEQQQGEEEAGAVLASLLGTIAPQHRQRGAEGKEITGSAQQASVDQEVQEKIVAAIIPGRLDVATSETTTTPHVYRI